MDPPLYTEEDFESDYYRFQEHTDNTKRVKFFVFSHRQSELKDSRYDKRTQDDAYGCPLDVDYVYLKNNLINLFAPNDESESHLEIHQNKREEGKDQFWDIFEKMKTTETLMQYDCFFFIFLTYMATDSQTGGMNIVVDQGKVSLDKIWDKVSEIPIMTGKPKVFLVQADDVKLMEDPNKISKGGIEKYEVVERKIPTDSDHLSIVSTIPGRNFVQDNDPSFLIKAFVEMLNENPETDLLTLSVLINERVADLIEKSTMDYTKAYAKQDKLSIPCTTSTLRKLLVMKYLNELITNGS